MDGKHTFEELNSYSKEQLISIIMGMQGQLEAMDEKLELLLEQIRIANSYRFGRKTERLDQIDGQMSLFDEIDATADQPRRVSKGISDGWKCLMRIMYPTSMYSGMEHGQWMS